MVFDPDTLVLQLAMIKTIPQEELIMFKPVNKNLGIPHDQLKEYFHQEQEWDKQDNEILNRKERRNELESVCYKFRDSINQNLEQLKPFLTSEAEL